MLCVRVVLRPFLLANARSSHSVISEIRAHNREKAERQIIRQHEMHTLTPFMTAAASAMRFSYEGMYKAAHTRRHACSNLRLRMWTGV